MSPTELFASHGWWLASRAAGLIALACVTISVVIGLAMAGKVSRRPGIGPALKALHEQTALIGIVAIAVHGVTLLGDSWLNPGTAGIAIPFTIAYRPVWTGLGVLAGWMAVVFGLSFYARKRIGTRLWRKAHRFSVLIYALGVAHTLGAGTDAQSAWLFWPVIATVPVVAGLFAARVVHGVRLSRRRAAALAGVDRDETRTMPESARRPSLATGLGRAA